MLRISSHTFGCKLNQSETDSALRILCDSGYEIVPWEAGADLYLINTCTVTSKGEQKARRLIRQVQQLWPQAVVLASGCYAVLEREKLEALGDRVCALSDQPARLCQLLSDCPLANSDELLARLRSGIARLEAGGGRQLRAGAVRRTDFPEVLLRSAVPDSSPSQIPGSSSDTAAQVPRLQGPAAQRFNARHQRYFLKIQDGCNRTCSFCRIRLARGPSRSLELPLLVEQLQGLEAQGYAEAVITGVHINSYHYRGNGRDYFLGELLQNLLSATQQIRLRLSSLESEAPESARTQQLFKALALQRVCPHFHISLQSGSEQVLRQMRRGYTAAQQLRYIRRLKELRPRAFFSSDVIVGFPGEREQDFAATCELLEQQQFAAVHAFSYSPRPGTLAFAMPRVQESIVKQRMQRIQQLARTLGQNYLESCLGREAKVLLEEQRNGYWLGYSENYVRIRIRADHRPQGTGITYGATTSHWQSGDLVRVRLQSCTEAEQQNEARGEAEKELLLEGIPLGPF